MEAVGYAVSKKDWDELVQGRARSFFGDAEEVSIGGCILSATELAAVHDEKQVSIVFDEGRMTPNLLGQLDRVKKNYEGPSELVHIGFSPIERFAPLQAADTIATESYWHAGDCLLDEQSPLRPHFRSLLGKIVAAGFIMDRSEILKNLARFNRDFPSDPMPSEEQSS